MVIVKSSFFFSGPKSDPPPQNEATSIFQTFSLVFCFFCIFFLLETYVSTWGAMGFVTLWTCFFWIVP